MTQSQPAHSERGVWGFRQDDGSVLIGDVRYVEEAENRRLREALEWFARGDWVEDDPLAARDRAREALSR